MFDHLNKPTDRLLIGQEHVHAAYTVHSCQSTKCSFYFVQYFGL